MCSRCYQQHRKAGTLDTVTGSVFDASTYVPARERSGAFGEFQMRPTHLTTGTGRLHPSPAGFTRASVVDEPLVDLPPAVTRAAALQVCSHATSPDDARDLLGTLGLLQAAAA
jgi:hypothetical protein